MKSYFGSRQDLSVAHTLLNEMLTHLASNFPNLFSSSDESSGELPIFLPAVGGADLHQFRSGGDGFGDMC